MQLTIRARDVRHADLVLHNFNGAPVNFEVKAIRRTAGDYLVCIEGPRLDETGKERLSFQPDTLIEVDRV